MTIFDIITSTEIAAYWELHPQDEPPYLGEELWDTQQKLGLDLKWIKGAQGLPVVLKESAFDATAIPRPRIGFEEMRAEMPYFKESMYIDEELRQQLNMVLQTNNQTLIDTIQNRIFDDEMQLLRGARAQRERMRMMALTTGMVSLKGNGQVYDYDYGVPSNHKKTVETAWSDPNAPIIDDIREMKDTIVGDTGVEIARAVCSSKVFGYFRKNNELKMSINVRTDGEGFISDEKIRQFFMDELDLDITRYDKRYIDETGKQQRFVAEDIFVMMPSGMLGTFWFGTTPEQSDLLNSGVANVSIVDTGVAITTSKKVDPVQVETKVSMVCLPDFPTADQIAIMDVDGE